MTSAGAGAAGHAGGYAVWIEAEEWGEGEWDPEDEASERIMEAAAESVGLDPATAEAMIETSAKPAPKQRTPRKKKAE